MTTILTTPRPSPLRVAADAARAIGHAIWNTYTLGGRAWIAAPALLGIAILPELVQHVVEIQLGMFASPEAFRAHANDGLRWGFGYAKIAGFVLAILMSARFWALGSVRRALLVPPGTLLRVILVCAAIYALSLPFEWLNAQGAPLAANAPLQLIGIAIQAGGFLYLAGTLLGDPALRLRRTFTALLPAALVLALLVLLAYFPASALHIANHKLAMGQPAAIVWALMLFDSLLVGLFAALLGSALFVGYRTGLTWRGWSVHPARIAEA
jgi:hypothetical protein